MSKNSSRKLKDNLFQEYKNQLINYDKFKKKYLLSSNKNNISEEKKNQFINISSIKNINKPQKYHFEKSFNLKKIKLNRIIKDNKSKLKMPKFNSEISSLKYYLLYSEPGISKKSLENIHDDLDEIQKKINNFDKKEENKINNNDKITKNMHIDNDKMVVNIPDYNSNKKNIINSFLGLCGTYEKYNYEFSRIKNLFGTKINLFEKKDIIKNIIKNKELNNKTINNYSIGKKNLKQFFPLFPKINSKNDKINKTKSFDKKKFHPLNAFKKNKTGILFKVNNLKRIPMKNSINQVESNS